MRVPFGWIKEFVAVTASAEEVAHKLTMVGLEVEAIERIDDDVVFEVNVTPNRPDCLSVIGIARELSAAYGIPLTIPEHSVAAEPAELDFNIDILDSSLCRRYAGRIVKSVAIAPSPEWLSKRLEQCGIRSINNIVDITNYVLLEFGHPLHAFDLNTVRGHRVRVGTPDMVKGAGAQVVFKTLDGVERAIPGDSLLIWDAKGPIAIAGIMGGQDAEVSDTTKDIFIESAYFDTVSVRKTSKALGLKTEASYRFERGTDIKVLKKALDRAAYLMKKVAGGVIYGKLDIYPKNFTPAVIRVRYEKVNRILGLTLAKDEIAEHLTALGFTVEEAREYFTVKPPAYRTDVTRDADIMEEIARAYGYDRIPAELPKATIGIEGPESARKSSYAGMLLLLKESFLKSGFTEAVNFSFMGTQDLDLLGIAGDDERRAAVEIKNPLRVEDSFMRTTLVPSLVRNVVHNVSHDNRDFKLFEISRIFANVPLPSDSRLREERNRLAAVYYREKTRSLYKDETSDFYLIKGLFEAILKDLKVGDYSFVRSSEPFLHPGQSADIFIGDTRIGYMGALSPIVIGKLDIKAQKPSVFLIEFDIDALFPKTMQAIKYRPLPRYPYIERDTALVLDAALEASTLINWLKAYPSDLIEDIFIFDVYQGKNIPEGKKSIAFSIRYRSADRTLKDEEIDSLHNALVEYISDKTKGEVRK